MSEETLYKYRIFTVIGVFNVLCKIDTKEKLWDVFLSSKNDKPIKEKLYHLGKPEDDKVSLIIRPSMVGGIDMPHGTEPVLPVEEKDEQKITSRAIPNRVVIDSRPKPGKNTSKNLASKRRVKR